MPINISSTSTFLRRLVRLAAFAILLGGGLRAQSVTFTFTWDHSYLDAITITQNGLTLHAENPNSDDGVFTIDDDGLYLTAHADYGNNRSFTLRFDQDVLFESYVIGYINWGTVGYFDLYDPVEGASLNNTLSEEGFHAFNTPFILRAGQSATLTAFFIGDYEWPLAELLSITVSVVPEPGTAAAFAGLIALGAVATRRSTRRV